MPFQFNVGDHSSPIWKYTSFNSSQYSKLKWARNKLFKMVKNNPGCNAYFRTLPKGRSLSDMINDSSIWVKHIDHFTATWGNPRSFRGNRGW